MFDYIHSKLRYYILVEKLLLKMSYSFFLAYNIILYIIRTICFNRNI